MSIKLKLLFVILVLQINLVLNKLILKKVVILNRHSLRTPLSNNLNQISPKDWPKWEKKPGFLTAKGVELAGYMGSYFAAWLKKEKILLSRCPTEDDLYVFSNMIERTLSSAKSFVEKGFKNCTIHVHHTGISNSIFNSIIHNTSATFRELVLDEMKEILNTVQLKQAYEILNNILNYKKSRYCEVEKKCNLAEDMNQINVTPGLRPQLEGPLKIGKEIIDTFLMQYYEGFPTEDVAWGQIADANTWETVNPLVEVYYNVTYKTRLIARDIAKPLIKYMSDIFLKDDNNPKVTLLVGHDVNLYTVFQTLLVKPYKLHKQNETTPIGSAAVFQKWEDDESNKKYFKLSYVYQSTEQLRHSNILSLESPPQIKTLELEKCKVNKDGFCLWEDFRTILISL